MMIEVYQSPLSGAWYWRLVARNGRVIADSGEGYASKFNAKRAAINAANLMEIADIVYEQ
jgi:uncharacterized protein YegP (UPF0339 family)